MEAAGFVFWSARQTTVHGKQTKEEKMAAGHEEKEKAMQSGAESKACFTLMEVSVERVSLACIRK